MKDLHREETFFYSLIDLLTSLVTETEDLKACYADFECTYESISENFTRLKDHKQVDDTY